ncbi:MAG: septation protein A [Proteobacteria bacterium]|nr:septation protein A [Pseudomonadota bacterium]
MAESEPTRTAPTWLKPTVDYGPLLVFLAFYLATDLLVATAALIAVTLLALVLALWIERRVPWMPVVTAAVVGVFGGLTLWSGDEIFIKMKPTIAQLLFAAVLLGSLALGRPVLKPLLGAAWPMDDLGWRRLSLRFAIFFLVMAALNEAVWRTQSTDVWVLFKVFGLFGLTMLFSLAQVPLMSRHRLPEAAAEPSEHE